MEENYFIGYRLIRWHVNILSGKSYSVSLAESIPEDASEISLS